MFAQVLLAKKNCKFKLISERKIIPCQRQGIISVTVGFNPLVQSVIKKVTHVKLKGFLQNHKKNSRLFVYSVVKKTYKIQKGTHLKRRKKVNSR